MKRIILFFVLSIFQVYAVRKLICDSFHFLNLNENDVVFFESPNFPKTINNETKQKCALIINGLLPNNNTRIILALTSGRPIGAQIIDNGYSKLLEFPVINFYATNSSSIIFSFANNETKSDWEAFRGFVTYETMREYSCPLSNRKKPFKFSNETEVLYLRSSYEKYLEYDTIYRQEKQCTWNFVAPAGYGFKINSLNTVSKILVSYNNKEEFVQSRLTHYYNTTNITITFTTAYENIYEAPKYFFARISIINLLENAPNDDCAFVKTGEAYLWKIPESTNSKIIKCQRRFTIHPKHQLYARVIDLETEENVDVLRYYVDEELLHPIQLAKKQLYAFLPYNQTKRDLTFEYSSDESISYKGFTVKFEDVECECKSSKFIIPCNGKFNYSIMRRNNDFNYCADLVCTFEVILNETCKNNEILLKVFKDIEDPFSDYLVVSSDNHTVLNTTGIYKRTYKGEMQNALILHNRKTTMKFHSSSTFNGYKSFPIGYMRLWMKAINEVTRLPKEIISSEKQQYIYESNKIPSNSVLTIELSKTLMAKNNILNIFYETSNIQHLMTCIIFYTDEKMRNIYEFNPHSTSVPINKSITIYKHVDCNADVTKLFIKAAYTSPKNCMFQKNIVSIEEVMKRNNKLSMVSGSKTTCQLTIVNDVGNYIIKEMLMRTKYNQSVEIYNNAKMDSSILILDRNSSFEWKLMTFNALSYLIVIPPRSSFLIEFYNPLNVIEFKKPLLTYYETPYFGTPSFKVISSNTTYQISKNVKAIFTLSIVDLSPSGILQIILLNGNVKRLTMIGQTFIINSKKDEILEIYYNESELDYKGAMIDIKIIEK